MVEAAREHAFFRLVVIDGKVYWEKYRDAYQTRDVFTIWGILQLLRLYPGKLPDLDIMFEAGDVPVVLKSNYTGHESNAPPLFHYCGDDDTLDIVFPDWSFWGWYDPCLTNTAFFFFFCMHIDDIVAYVFRVS